MKSLLVAILLAVSANAHAETDILITPVPCPGDTLCNVYHVRYYDPSGAIIFSRDFPSNTMASKASIELRIKKGVIRIWSDK